MRDFTQDIRELQRRLSEAEVYLCVGDNRERFAVLEHEVAEPGLWDDQDRAKKLNAEYANIKEDIGVFDKMSDEIENVEVLHELARDEDDASQEPEIEAAIVSVGATFDQLELRSLFTGEHDDTDCIVQINAKDGGVDAQDFSEMLLRMYEKWCERRGFTITLNSVSEGAEAGIMSAEVTISGRYAYGLMSAERGTHRLVRISPFDNQGRRQTSFSAVQAQVGWGSQIRSYVMQPYQMVKDLRTEIETANVSGVLDGDIDFLIEGFLQHKRAQGEPES